jgi:hypothetical protein
MRTTYRLTSCKPIVGELIVDRCAAQVCMYLILTAVSESVRRMSQAQIEDAVESLVAPVLIPGPFPSGQPLLQDILGACHVIC